jgi:hypothetical protein
LPDAGDEATIAEVIEREPLDEGLADGEPEEDAVRIRDEEVFGDNQLT